MSIDIGWFVALSLFTAIYIVLDAFVIIRYERVIKRLKELVKSWGDCAYVCGYNDGLNNKSMQPPVIDETEKTDNAIKTF